MTTNNWMSEDEFNAKYKLGRGGFVEPGRIESCPECGGVYGEHDDNCPEKRNHPFAVVESMTTIQRLGVTIRIWRDEKQLLPEYKDNEEMKQHGEGLIEQKMPFDGIVRVMVNKFKRINAIEVKDEYGNGPVVYPEWP